MEFQTIDPSLILWSLLVIAVVLYSITALIAIYRSQDLSGTQALGWSLVVILVPILAAAIYFRYRNNTQKTTR